MLVKAQKYHTKLIEKGCWWRVLNDTEKGMGNILSHFCQRQEHDPDWSVSTGNSARAWHTAFKSVPAHGIATSYKCSNCKSTAPAKVRAYIYLLEVEVPQRESNLDDMLKMKGTKTIFPYPNTTGTTANPGQWVYNTTTTTGPYGIDPVTTIGTQPVPGVDYHQYPDPATIINKNAAIRAQQEIDLKQALEEAKMILPSNQPLK